MTINKYTEETDVIKVVLGHIKNKVYKGTTNWKDGNTLVFTNKKVEEGTITFKDKNFTITGELINDLYIKNKKIYDDALKNKATELDVKETPLEGMFNNLSSYGNLEMSPQIIKLLNKEFKKLDIDKVQIDGSLRQNSTIKNSPTLYITTDTDGNGESLETGYIKRLKTFLFNEFKTDYKTKEEITIKEIQKIKPFVKEKCLDIKIKGTTIGFYYPERNLITLIFNPFELKKYTVYDTKLEGVWIEIFKAFKEVNIKKVDVSKIREKLFITEFMKGTKKKLANIKTLKTSAKKDIENYEKRIREYIGNYHNYLSEEEFLQTMIENKGKGLFAEIEKVKKLPFIEKLVIEGSEINIKYKATFMPIPDMKRNNSGKTYGKRYIWIGSIGFKITPSEFTLYGDIDINSHCHPHGSGFPTGSPCFGSGDGNNKIYDLLATNKFVDLAKMLWFWIKTYKNGGAYVKVYNAYDSILSQGYPLLDEKGKRISINDPVRIKSGEQVKLTKASNFEENEKRFNNVKLEA